MTQRTVVANTDYEGTDQRYIELNCGHAAVVNPDEAPKEGETFDCIACPDGAKLPETTEEFVDTVQGILAGGKAPRATRKNGQGTATEPPATPAAEPITAKQARKAAAARVTGTAPAKPGATEKAAEPKGRISAQRAAIYKLMGAFIENVMGTGLSSEMMTKTPGIRIVEGQPNIMFRFQVGPEEDRHEYTVHLREIDPTKKS